MLNASLTDNRKAATKPAGELAPGDCFIYDHMLCMVIDSSCIGDISDNDTVVYGVILQCDDPTGTIGYLVDMPNYHFVVPVEVKADFTIVE